MRHIARASRVETNIEAKGEQEVIATALENGEATQDNILGKKLRIANKRGGAEVAASSPGLAKKLAAKLRRFEHSPWVERCFDVLGNYDICGKIRMYTTPLQRREKMLFASMFLNTHVYLLVFIFV